MGNVFFKSNRGNTIISALFLTSVSMIMFLGVGYSISRLESQQSRESSNIYIKQILNSAIDYTATGLKQNWCMSGSWSKRIVGTCGLDDIYNLERLLLSDDTIKYISTGGVYNPEKLRLYKIGPVSVALSAVQTDHPLFSMLVEAKKYGVTSIEFTVERVQNIQAPSRGKEVPIKITVEMKHGGFLSTSSKIEALYYFFPRELGSNALVLAHDLFLNAENSGELPTLGDSGIMPNSAPVSSGGLRFESPVYVNGDVVIPKQKNSKFANVTFVDKLILGGGVIREDGALFAPKTLGGNNDKYNFQISSMGGFLGGVELDAEPDPGLNVLSGRSTLPQPYANSFELCKNRLAAKMDLSKTRDSQLWLKVTSSDTSTVSGMLNLGKVNSFLPQSVPGGGDDISISNPAQFKIDVTGNNEFPIVRFWIDTMDYTGDAGKQLQAYVSLTRGAKATLSSIASPTATITIEIAAHTIGNNVQDNVVDFKLTYNNLDLIPMGTTDPLKMKSDKPRFVFRFEAFDLGYANLLPTRSKAASSVSLATAKPSDSAHYRMDKFKKNGFKLVKDPTFVLETSGAFSNAEYYTCSSLGTAECNASGDIYYENEGGAVAAVDQVHSPTTDAEDLAAVDLSCSGMATSATQTTPSFHTASWDQSFSYFTKDAWSFAGNGVWKVNEAIQGTIASVEITSSRADPKFNVVSYSDLCTVKAEANFVTGFFACDKFVIETRTDPLRIIGTVIANKLIVDDSAIKAGIIWSSIYNFNAGYELRESGILKGTNCDNTNKPIWLPYPSVPDMINVYNCNAISLRAKADPFRWTTVDPDCGPTASSGSIACKGRIKRWVAKEIYRKRI